MAEVYGSSSSSSTSSSNYSLIIFYTAFFRLCHLARKLTFCANLHLCLLELMLLNQKNEATRFCFGIDTV